MFNISTSRRALTRSAALLAALYMLLACSPNYDWRLVRGADAPFEVLLPAKPSTLTRTIDLDGMQVSMTMTAADVDKAMFAVGSAQLEAASDSQKALLAMKTALVNNINGTVTRETAGPGTLTVEAVGPSARNGAPAVRLHARFIARQRWIYQVIVVGPERAVPEHELETFFQSFVTK